MLSKLNIDLENRTLQIDNYGQLLLVYDHHSIVDKITSLIIYYKYNYHIAPMSPNPKIPKFFKHLSSNRYPNGCIQLPKLLHTLSYHALSYRIDARNQQHVLPKYLKTINVIESFGRTTIKPPKHMHTILFDQNYFPDNNLSKNLHSLSTINVCDYDITLPKKLKHLVIRYYYVSHNSIFRHVIFPSKLKYMRIRLNSDIDWLTRQYYIPEKLSTLDILPYNHHIIENLSCDLKVLKCYNMIPWRINYLPNNLEYFEKSESGSYVTKYPELNGYVKTLNCKERTVIYTRAHTHTHTHTHA